MLTLFFAICVAVSVAAVADTNAVVATAEKCQPATSASVVAASGDTAFDRAVKAELKAAAHEAKEEYEKRYKELKDAHSRFVTWANIWIGLLGISAATIGIGTPILQWKYKEDIDKSKQRLDKLETIATQFTMRRAKDSLAMMRFVWADFLAQMQGGNSSVNGREIVHPLYRVAEVLWQACEIGDAHFLNESVTAVVTVIKGYRRVAPSGSVADNSFKTYAKRNKILTDSSNFHDLAHAMKGVSPSLRTVLTFMNEFGITMFGEVCG